MYIFNYLHCKLFNGQLFVVIIIFRQKQLINDIDTSLVLWKNCAENEMRNVFVTVMLINYAISLDKKSGNMKMLCT